MSRELDRRISAIEAARNAEHGAGYVVLDYPPEDDDRKPYEMRSPMTEAEWVATYCEPSLGWRHGIARRTKMAAARQVMGLLSGQHQRRLLADEPIQKSPITPL